MKASIKPLSREQEAEITRFSEEIEKLESGALDPDDFKRFRLENGVYGIRGTTDRHMVRLKIKYGAMTPEQLEMVASLKLLGVIAPYLISSEPCGDRWSRMPYTPFSRRNRLKSWSEGPAFQLFQILAEQMIRFLFW